MPKIDSVPVRDDMPTLKRPTLLGKPPTRWEYVVALVVVLAVTGYVAWQANIASFSVYDVLHGTYPTLVNQVQPERTEPQAVGTILDQLGIARELPHYNPGNVVQSLVMEQTEGSTQRVEYLSYTANGKAAGDVRVDIRNHFVGFGWLEESRGDPKMVQFKSPEGNVVLTLSFLEERTPMGAIIGTLVAVNVRVLK
jgi:hypothetical protein